MDREQLEFRISQYVDGTLSAADMVAALYLHKMRLTPNEPDWPDRDRFIQEKGRKPIRDSDGDFHCPDHPDKVFVTQAAYKWHRSRVHADKGAP